MKSSTIASQIILDMLESAQRSGYDVKPLLRESGISANILVEPKSRVSFRQLSDLSLALMQLLDDESYGLLGKPLRRNTFKLLCYSAINGKTIADVLRIFTEFMNVLDLDIHFSLIQQNKHAKYQLTRTSNNAISNNYVIAHMFIILHRTLCWMARARIPLTQVDFDYPSPPYSSEYRYLFYGAPVSFDKADSAMSISEHYLALENTRTIDELNVFLKRMPLTILSQTIDEDLLSAQIRSWMERQINRHKHAPDIDAASSYLKRHPQSIRRQLNKEGTSYQSLKMEVRRDMAINLITRSDDSIEGIAAKLDFSEPSAFIRAFKSWTGLTPLSYRKLSLQGDG
ncbi:MAG: AraC family transcriptional regulator [Pseudomonadales bacterium]